MLTQWPFASILPQDVAGPKQPNYCDCGIYVLHYFERFFSNPAKFCQEVIPSRLREHEEWKARQAEGRRAYWREVIEELAQRWESKERSKGVLKATNGAAKREAGSSAESDSEDAQRVADANTPMEVDSAMQEA